MGRQATVPYESFGVRICYNSVNLLKAKQRVVVGNKRQVKLLTCMYQNSLLSAMLPGIMKKISKACSLLCIRMVVPNFL